MDITLLGRSSELSHDFTKPPGKNNPGGGIGVKLKYIQEAIPHIRPIVDIKDAGGVNITEFLWFFEDVPKLDQAIENYSKSRSMKMLLISDTGCCRMSHDRRSRIFDATDCIVVSSRYTENWVKAYAPRNKVEFVGDPIDTNAFSPTNNKDNSIIGCSKLGLEKNAPKIAEIYKKLPVDIEKRFIGGIDLWGVTSQYPSEINIEMQTEMDSVCDWIEPNATYDEVKDIYYKSKAFIGDSKYDTFCYSMVEAMASGMWCFLGDHPLYDSVPHAFRFSTVEEAVNIITEKMPLLDGFCEESVEFVRDNYSFDVYKKSMSELIGRKVING